MGATTKYPLAWPAGFPRTSAPQRSRFRYPSFDSSRRNLYYELHMMNASDVVLSSNVPLRLDGEPRAGARSPEDMGVAVYFKLDGNSCSLACDAWDTVADNIHALMKTVEAMRGIDRWKCSEVLERMFTGFKALPALGEGSGTSWWVELGIEADATVADIEEAFRLRAKSLHPDVGGDPVRWNDIVQAKHQGLQTAKAREVAT